MRPALATVLAVPLLAGPLLAGCAARQAETLAAPGGADYISCAWPQPPAHQAMARHGKAPAPEKAQQGEQAATEPAR